MKKITNDIINTNFIDDTNVPIAFQDENYNIQWGNRAYRKAVGLPIEKITGKKCYSAWGRKTPCNNCPVEDTLKNGEEKKGDPSIKNCRNAEFIWLTKDTVIKNSTGTFVGTVETTSDLSKQVSHLNRQQKTTASILRLLDYSYTHSMHELLKEFLDEAESLTESEIGFYHFVEEDQKSLSLQMWSTRTLKVCSSHGAGTHYPIEKAGVWVDCVRTGEPVIHNDYANLPDKKGYPEGHVKVTRELVVPVIRNKKLMAILGVGNKRTDYTEEDVKIVTQLADLAWEAVLLKRTEEEKEKLQEQFMHAQKMESIGRLAGGVAHDFNNMLNIILGRADLSLEQLTPSQSLYKDLMEIRTAAQRSAKLTSQLLAFARKQNIRPIRVNLNHAVGDMIDMLRRLIGENIDLAWIPATGLGSVKIDPDQIGQILANLTVNARDAISGVGKITIETQNVYFDEAHCEMHPGFHPGEYIMLAVSDNGCGIDKKILPHIFEPFYTTKELGEGTGLGLATIYGIVKQNKGFINVYSEPGKGSTFKIYLSRYIGKGMAGRLEANIHPLKHGSETILLVEDEIMILNLITKMLMDLGYRVLSANTPLEALDLAKSYTGKIDLLITDVLMPDMNGQDLSESLETFIPGIKTLFMSGYTANHITRHDDIDKGIVFLQKPFSKNHLADKVREAMNHLENDKV